LAAYLLIFLFIVFLGLQFVGPRVTYPPVTGDLVAPDDVKAILKTSCYNCHSNETHLWWYDKIAPASWLVARDVKRGRMHMNFSTFGQLSPAAQKAYLFESATFIQLGAMPPANYLFVHPDAKVTPEQLDTLKKYLHPSNEVTPASTEATQAADQQYQQWIAGGGTTLASNVKPELNGLTFLPDFKNWKPVSYTDRYDNGTMRMILGNDVTQKAIASGNVQPWPDGSAFAKVTFKQQPDAQGNVWTGQFIQVELMLKDAEKYRKTEGWGFGRWKTTDLKPYGKTANYVTECTSCHAPMQPNDFVYTMPLRDGTPPDAFNPLAALPDGLPYPVRTWNALTSSIDHAHGTTSVLYGNDAAFVHARTSPQTPYPAGAILALVTWQQQEDKHWFGGRIPGTLQSVEVVGKTSAEPSSGPLPYKKYTGSPLKEQPLDPTTAGARVIAITSLRAAVMP
ncbi:MAG TPA: cytochrome P460 family protein, partial [Candidatus Methylacidiphilales bacterium]|nr:cytochrome P460 family protein [Candidatus Methylacidiphilales bacterium]